MSRKDYVGGMKLLTREILDAALVKSNFWGLCVKWSHEPPGNKCLELADQAETALFEALCQQLNDEVQS